MTGGATRWRGCALSSGRPTLTSWKSGNGWGHRYGPTTEASAPESRTSPVVKLTFFKGASLKDPRKLFNSSLDGNVRRAIDIHEGEQIDASAFKALIRAAVALNASGGKKPAKRS